MTNIDSSEITMEDVEVAIKVINIFMRQAELARRTMRRLGISQGRGDRMPSSMEDFMQMAWKTRPQQQSEEPEPPEALTDEERERLNKIKEEMKKK